MILKLLSHLLGKIASLRLGTLSSLIIKCYVKIFKIDLSISLHKISEFKSLQEFFVRKLRPELRPVGIYPLHPCDSSITNFGRIKEGLLFQAKGKTFDLKKLLDRTDKFSYFITYYLSPRDCHRVFSPVTGVIRRVTIIPGSLWPVNSPSIKFVKDLFIRNERLIVDIECEDSSKVSVIFIGATNVGSIRVSFDQSVVTNLDFLNKDKKIKEYDLKISAGDELGMFSLGSTVIVLYNREFQNLKKVL